MSAGHYPDGPGGHSHDTSRDAADDVEPRVTALRAAVLEQLRLKPLSVHQCALLLDLPVPTIQPRFSELFALDLIEDSELRAVNHTGKRAIVWAIKRPPVADPPPPPVIGRKRKEQGDLFGEWANKKPKAGDGSHIKLKREPGERGPVPGMASFAGEGPPNKYCQDCYWFGSIMLTRPDLDTIEHASAACVLWAQRMGHAAPPGRNRTIAHCAACKHFRDANDKFRAFRIGPDGALEEH